jgi:L-cystine transport system substrate-binding protein
MTDDRLHRWLEAADQPQAPDPAFAAALRDELRHELGFIRVDTVPLRPIRLAREGARSRRGPLNLLLVAALLAAGAISVAAVAGGLLNRQPERQPSLLSEIREMGRVRVAIRPDHPQFSVPGQPAAGFDADVARALADHLGLRSDLVVIDVSAILSGGADQQWDVALPSVASWQIDSSRFLVSSPYYRWPHRLVVADTSAATGPADLANEPVCAVAGDAGEAWLRGQSGGVVASPITTRIVTRASDDDCLAALAAGDVAAVVTARLSDADLKVRSGIRVIGGADPEPRAMVVRVAQAGGPEVISAIEEALSQMRADGTLRRLSQNRFGGADLSAP